uniref:Uncharacterized protein n=1 Tax=Fibrocapsa japonica TaxID=94617 RepID=A0A7S2USJ9_9STRA|mmetsp:Transcript_11270/g.16612  ORF Transcript_11270/g.16612 Transcript_11270/m.16612 type:complete len:180 (+) Transcript_11270:55-594(+)|eukprot:CAMPEP_0113935864 /NCGR_PEP_ID=MMETSP1339-20121228/2914_1 /TAXON_ID=94617 /ORGANISM="Fibrocapsa japonica" /LENGTH=179 /DNA_ID=CAMNT_0000938151 /DNA_START=49 /DNA_END=588 /DNA_ORIENTATION=- /assembly_acc=CAM_ASM_000762
MIYRAFSLAAFLLAISQPCIGFQSGINGLTALRTSSRIPLHTSAATLKVARSDVWGMLVSEAADPGLTMEEAADPVVRTVVDFLAYSAAGLLLFITIAAATIAFKNWRMTESMKNFDFEGAQKKLITSDSDYDPLENLDSEPIEGNRWARRGQLKQLKKQRKAQKLREREAKSDMELES